MVSTDLFRPGIDIEGRPDFANPNFGVTRATHFKPYAASKVGLGYLIHKVAYVKLCWYAGHYGYMKRLDSPRVNAYTVCRRVIYLNAGKKSGMVCEIPDTQAVLCGRCHGEIATFSKMRKERISKRWAKDHLGCKREGEFLAAYRPKIGKELKEGE